MYVLGFSNSPTLTIAGTTLTTNPITPRVAFVVKLSPTGAWQWMAGTDADLTKDMVVTPGGEAYITGAFATTVRFGSLGVLPRGNYTADAFVAKVAANGTWQWVIRAGGDLQDGATALALAPGGVYVGGDITSNPADFGNILIRSAGASKDTFVGLLSAAGVWQWVRSVGSNRDDAVSTLTTDHQGNAYVTGLLRGQARFDTLTAVATFTNPATFVASLSPTGSWRWVTTTGGVGGEEVYGATVDGADNLYLAGQFSYGQLVLGPYAILHTPTQSADLFVTQLRPNGQFVGAIGTGSVGYDVAASVAIGSPGAWYVTGTYGGPTISFDTITLTIPHATSNSYRSFLARLNLTSLGLPDHLPRASALGLAPNPAHNTVRLTGLPAGASAVEVVDALGRTVRTAPLAPRTSHFGLRTSPGRAAAGPLCGADRRRRAAAGPRIKRFAPVGSCFRPGRLVYSAGLQPVRGVKRRNSGG